MEKNKSFLTKYMFKNNNKSNKKTEIKNYYSFGLEGYQIKGKEAKKEVDKSIKIIINK